MKRAVAIDHLEHAVDEFLALVIGKAAQRDAAAKMIVAIRVSAGATKRTFSCDFDGQVRAVARKDAAPGLNDLARANVSRHVPLIISCYPL